MRNIELTFRPEGSGSQMEDAFLGTVRVGRIHITPSRVSWLFHLPGATGLQSLQWHPAKTKQEAQSALMNATQGWLKMAGLAE